jgi:hypothetical protein
MSRARAGRQLPAQFPAPHSLFFGLLGGTIELAGEGRGIARVNSLSCD